MVLPGLKLDFSIYELYFVYKCFILFILKQFLLA